MSGKGQLCQEVVMSGKKLPGKPKQYCQKSPTVLVERKILWITTAYLNWVATLQWGTTQWETLRHR